MPTHIRAAARLKDIYREQGRTADYVAMLEMGTAAVARKRDPARIARSQRRWGAVLEPFRSSRARGAQPTESRKLAPEDVRSIESAARSPRARRFRAVVRLYGWSWKGRRTHGGGPTCCSAWAVLGEKLEELDAAAQRLAEVVRLRPRDEKALDLLAGVYANPNWIGATASIARPQSTTRSRGSARRQRRRKRDRGAAPGAGGRSGARGNAELLERVYFDGRAVPGARSYLPGAIRRRDRAAERIDFLAERPQLAEGEIKDGAEAQAGRQWDIARSSRRTAQPRRSSSSCTWPATSTRSSPSCASASWARSRSPASGGTAMTELAALYRDRLGDREQAAVYLHAMLEIEPENQMALGRLRRAFPRKGGLGGAGRPAGVLLRTRAAGGRSSPTSQSPGWRRSGAVRKKQLARRGARDRGLAPHGGDRPHLPAGARGAAAPPAQGQELGPPGRAARTRSGRAGGSGESHRDPAARRADPPGEARQSGAGDRDLQGDPRAEPRTRCRCARSSRPRARGRLRRAWRAAARGRSTARNQTGTGRPAAPGAGDPRRADRRPRQGQWAANEILQAVPATATRSRGSKNPRARRKPGRLVKVLEQHTKHAANPDEKIQFSTASPSMLRARCRIRPAPPSGWRRSSASIPTTARRWRR